jgi:hypothetical protein
VSLQTWSQSNASVGLLRRPTHRQRGRGRSDQGWPPPPHRRGRPDRRWLVGLVGRVEALDRSGELVAALGKRLDEPLLVTVVAEHAPHRSDLRRQRGVGYCPAVPEKLDQLALGDHPFAMVQQISQELERLSLQRDRRAIARKPAVRIEGENSRSGNALNSPS